MARRFIPKAWGPSHPGWDKAVAALAPPKAPEVPRVPCRCKTTRPPEPCSTSGQRKQWWLLCRGCGRRTRKTFRVENLTTIWNEEMTT